MEKIGHSQFLSILRAEFPELNAEFEKWAEDDYGDHFLMTDVRIFFEKAVSDENWPRVAHVFSVFDKIFRGADKNIKNVVYVSFLEDIDLTATHGNRLRELMSPELLHGHEEIDQYLIDLGTREKSYHH